MAISRKDRDLPFILEDGSKEAWTTHDNSEGHASQQNYAHINLPRQDPSLSRRLGPHSQCQNCSRARRVLRKFIQDIDNEAHKDLRLKSGKKTQGFSKRDAVEELPASIDNTREVSTSDIRPMLADATISNLKRQKVTAEELPLLEAAADIGIANVCHVEAETKAAILPRRKKRAIVKPKKKSKKPNQLRDFDDIATDFLIDRVRIPHTD
jgi:hypothetical protein